MNVIILAAGRGSRFECLTESTPKCMIPFMGAPLLEHQIKLFRDNLECNVVIVRGYCKEKIQFGKCKYYDNENYLNTNMLESLFCAENEIVGETIVTYGDLLFDDRFIRRVLEAKVRGIGVVVDCNWQTYFSTRFEDGIGDAESLVIDKEGKIIDIGESSPSIDKIQGQYVGLIKLDSDYAESFKRLYRQIKDSVDESWEFRGRKFGQLYMTDFLQLAINEGLLVEPIKVNNGWLEFDSIGDLNSAQVLAADEENFGVFNFGSLACYGGNG